MDSIVTKLKQLGYGEDVAFSEKFLFVLESHPFVRQPKPLTERSEMPHIYLFSWKTAHVYPAWESHRDEVIKFIETKITLPRLYYEYRKETSNRIKAFRPVVETIMMPKYQPIFPRLRDLLSFPEVREVMDPFRSDEFETDKFDHLVSIMDDLLVGWEANCLRKLEEIVRAQVPDIPEGTVVSDLAVAQVMRCRNTLCNAVFTEAWPNSVVHSCGPPFSPDILEDRVGIIHRGLRERWYELALDDILEARRWSASGRLPEPITSEVKRFWSCAERIPYEKLLRKWMPAIHDLFPRGTTVDL